MTYGLVSASDSSSDLLVGVPVNSCHNEDGYWHGADNSAAIPTVASLGKNNDFSQENSAFWRGGGGTLNCKGFDIDEAILKNPTLNLSMSIGEKTDYSQQNLQLDPYTNQKFTLSSQSDLGKLVASDNNNSLDSLLRILVSADYGSTWEELYVFNNNELSNATNNGYISIELPPHLVSSLRDLEVKVEGLVDGDSQPTVYIDSIFTSYQIAPPRDLRLESTIGLGGDKPVFTQSQPADFRFEVDSSDQNLVQSFASSIGQLLNNANELDLDLEVTVTNPRGKEFPGAESKISQKTSLLGNKDVWNITIEQPPSIKPGLHTVNVTAVDSTGNMQHIDQDFMWGVLAINTHKSIYQAGDDVNFDMAVLNERGQMVCDADVVLEIDGPSGATLSTDDQTIMVNDDCHEYGGAGKPDYEASWEVPKLLFGRHNGNYELTLTATTENGTYTIKDSFLVGSPEDIVIERDSFTRIYPVDDYDVSFDITLNEDFDGTIIETLPSSFKIEDYSEIYEIHDNRSLIRGSDVEIITDNESGLQYIHWETSLEKDNTYQFNYTYNAPDASPEFYLLGPLRFMEGDNEVAREPRKWQIASDETIPTTGLTLHLDATQGVYSDNGSTLAGNDDTVQEWHDQSGNDNHITQSTLGSRPVFKTDTLNGLPVLRGDGSKFFNTGQSISNFVSANARTIFIIFKTSSISTNSSSSWTNDGIISDVDGYFGVHLRNSPNRVLPYHYGSNDFSAPIGIDLEEWYISQSRHESGSMYHSLSWLEGSSSEESVTADNIGSLSYDLYVFRGYGSHSSYFDGDIAEILIYNQALSEGDRNTVNDYLYDKWLGDPATSIAGTVFSDSGETGSDKGSTIDLVIDGENVDSTTANVSTGEYEFEIDPSSITTGDLVTVFIDGGTESGSAVTIYNDENIADLDIYNQSVRLEHEGSASLTNANIGHFDQSDDDDIPYLVSGSSPYNLAVDNHHTLIVATDKTYDPGGDVDTPYLIIDGTFEADDNEITLRAAGEPLIVNGTLDIGTSTIIYEGQNNEVVLEETFTGLANDSPWPASRWEDLDTSSGSTVDVQGEKGRMETGTLGGYQDYTKIRSTYDEFLDVDLVYELESNLEQGYWGSYIRASNEWTEGGWLDPTEGYYLEIFNDGRWWLGRAGEDYFDECNSASSECALNLSSSETHMIRFQAIGDTIRFKLWFKGDPEPEEWYASQVDPDKPLGPGHITLGTSGSSSGGRVFDFDNITATNFVNDGIVSIPNLDYYSLETNAGSDDTTFHLEVYAGVEAEPLDGAELIAASASNASSPFGFANNKSGPYIVHNKLWVFYVHNSELVWRTRDVGGGAWSSPQTVFASSNGEYSNLDFDGSHFHFVRTENGDVHGDIKYLRGEASSDGNISFDSEVTAWTESGYEAHREELVIKADSQKQPWIYFKRQNTAGDSFQPTVITSTATDGTWSMRSGFPLALQTADPDSIHGRGPDLVEVEPGKMLFMFIDWVTGATVAREWTAAGGLDDIETVGGWSSGRMSLVVLDNGTVMANYSSSVRRRTGPGEWWSTVDPPDASGDSFASLSAKGNEVRIWYVAELNTELRYQQTTDGGDNWAIPVTFRTGSSIDRFSASQLRGSEGDYHAILWREGSSPYDLWMGIEGETYATVGEEFLIDNNLTLRDSGGAATVSADNNNVRVVVTGDFIIESGQEFVASGTAQLNLEGSWDNSGTFTHSSGTVELVGSGKSVIVGETTFYNFHSSSVGKTLELESGTTMTFGGDFIIEGGVGAGEKINITSNSSGNRWLANFTTEQGSEGEPNVSYATVVDSGCSSSPASNNIHLDESSVDNLGNNGSCWLFPEATGDPPNNPTSLAQAKTDDTSILVGGWTNETSVVFSAQASDPDNNDTLSLCIEVQPLETSFTDIEDGCGLGVVYSGSPVTMSATLTSLGDDTAYHWQARVKDDADNYSDWVSFGGNLESERDFGIDTSAPTGGNVYDGDFSGVDVTFNDGSLSALSANWDNFNFDISGIDSYEYSIGTTQGSEDVFSWTGHSTNTSVTVSSLTLRTTEIYYFNVRAIDNAGNIATVSSDGQFVLPTLSFSVSPANVTFDNLNANNSYTDTDTTTLTTSTNAYGGYIIRARALDFLKNSSGNHTIPWFDGGTYVSPSTWGGSDIGYGYTSNDSSIQGSDKFSSGTLFAPFTTTAPGDIVADHTDNVTGNSIIDESFNITHRVTTSSSQAAGLYTTTIIYNISVEY